MNKCSKSTRHLSQYSSVKCHKCSGEGFFSYSSDDDDENTEPEVELCGRCFGKGVVNTFADKFFNNIERAYQRNKMNIRTKTYKKYN